MANENERQIKLTNGYFNLVVDVIPDESTFQLNIPGKNNQSWIQSIFNPKVEAKGNSFFMKFSSGYNSEKGKDLYLSSVSNTQMKISFADRGNEEIIKMVDDKSFIKIGYAKEQVKDENGKEYKQWKFKKFLDLYDAIPFIQQIMPLGSKYKLHLVGKIKFTVYNGEVYRNYDLQTLYLLTGNEDEGKEMDYSLGFNQNMIITNDSIDKSKLDEENIIYINSKIMTKSKGNYETIPVKFVYTIPTDEDKRAKRLRLLDRTFVVDEDVVRRVNVACEFECGYKSCEVTYDDLPQEAKDMIDDEIYTMEEVQKLYGKSDRVDNLLIIRPIMKKTDSGIVMDYSDSDYTLSDLEGISADVDEEINVSEEETSTDELLNELDNL